MKVGIFTLILSLGMLGAKAQDVTTLPAGRYETVIRNDGHWERGDIVLLDDGHYRISSSNETGEYRFSVAAQRVFFTSGPLKGAYARTTVHKNGPAILLPFTENQQLGLKLAPGDLIGAYRQ